MKMARSAKKKRKKKSDPWYDTDDESDESNWDAMEFVDEGYEEEVPPLEDEEDY